jgi:nitroreductase
MDLREALRTTGAVRSFLPTPVDTDTLRDILEDARFAPSGGNRQAWRVVVVSDPERRRAIADAYLDGWHDYIAHLLSGLIPFSPLASDEDRATALAARAAAEAASRPDGFAENLATVPAMVCILADVALLAATDRDLGRYTMTGGASIYPFVWSIILAARARGLGGVITTMATRNEPAVLAQLGADPTLALAAIVALGYPEHQPTKLTRHPVAHFATIDTVDGTPL